ncbi:UPF0047-domain-containing protein [Ophiobolus disseminans]|uniref:UPF0047-domain-containing protein n=1 Tax=Ophiobolus disseminans TaxID=1469910 RepID=A0A6A6ZZY6_9PLEO|nr:UPF0047-domain-containing protein [Ophiobolus disseminans]
MPAQQPQHRQHSTISPLTTCLLASFFLLALFPATFVSVLWFPYNYAFPAAIPRQSVTCTSPNVCSPAATMAWFQKPLTLPPKSRGSHLITPFILTSLPELRTIRTGLLHLFIQHTSCALSLNENFDPDVRADMSDALDRIVPEDKNGTGLYRHDDEGADDMPAHVKASLVGASVSVPITEGKLALGTWQGVWYLEFRDGRQQRRVLATVMGEKM